MFFQQTYIFPARGPSRLVVLDKQVGGADLALDSAVAARGSRAVVLSHVDLELFRVCACRGLPAAVLFDRVEVIRQVL